MSLVQTIAEIDPGHFARREDTLEWLREQASNLGFFPLPLQWRDIECFWIRLEPNEANRGKVIHFQKDYLYDTYALEIFKEVARYEI